MSTPVIIPQSDETAINAADLHPQPAKRPYKTLALMEFGDVRELTRGTGSAGNDTGVGRKNTRGGCLPPDARIETPTGFTLVKDLRAGDMVWTMNGTGERVVAAVLVARSVPARLNHQMVRLALSDARCVLATGTHPTSDGRTFESLRVGDSLDGATLVGTESLPYAGERTFDLLPIGGTGTYWADGVLIGTTISLADIAPHARQDRGVSGSDREVQINP